MEPIIGNDPMSHPYQGCILPLYYTGMSRFNQQAHPATSHHCPRFCWKEDPCVLCVWSGMRDSNPRPKFGRLGCYLYTNSAKWWMGWGSNPPLPGSRPTLGLQPSALSIEASHPDAACVAHGANVIITIAQGFSGTKNKLTACCHYTIGGSWYPEGLPTVEGFEPSLPSKFWWIV